MLKEKPENSSLRIFTDVLSYTYTCCIYLRCEDKTGASIQLVSAKARLAPTERPMIPHLDILRAVIGAVQGATIFEVHLLLNRFHDSIKLDCEY
ncbi:hypothetical protein NPIL_324881 [Nephila pilipes]|uniref:Uncharacterized protein n=1 Tax=Nephila pilipes TaxID=299642 RepID=A0A8X6QKT9_NEPPI|nr:hypothetical protein NPIL_492221 [Nephila pilipes]GFU24333.1 hypothetical protein NPIL_324881 [Nephila pilipes]